MPKMGLGMKEAVRLCLAAIALYLRRSWTCSAAFSALAVLARPDGILVSGLLAVDYFFLKRKSFRWKPVLVRRSGYLRRSGE